MTDPVFNASSDSKLTLEMEAAGKEECLVYETPISTLPNLLATYSNICVTSVIEYITQFG